ncbi:uncharacterized protein EV422DRAFT_507339 [Fimicolochytrium jonesii]|uniref:uncharacterized protein n=1 Tax=Fimicolochytrium jonesii TaxID=1396493 RepID=UPI0022FEA6B1|nr:uncharacterized protein EV422DRAFT_507339 [Fimicolochytrium jonesii]KAI8819714.1 hypothetical protein EV422DRAFT_507339 [Fimicolochytrium jonesii]
MGPYFVLGDQLINLDQVKTARRVPGDWDHKVVINNELSINFGSQSNNELETLAKALNARHHEKEVGPTERKVEELEKKVNCLWNMPDSFPKPKKAKWAANEFRMANFGKISCGAFGNHITTY